MIDEDPLVPTVGLFSSYLPRGLVYALGCRPVRVFPSAGKPTAAEAFLPRNFCSLDRLILAGFLEDENAGLEAVIFADEDAHNKHRGAPYMIEFVKSLYGLCPNEPFPIFLDSFDSCGTAFDDSSS